MWVCTDTRIWLCLRLRVRLRVAVCGMWLYCRPVVVVCGRSQLTSDLAIRKGDTDCTSLERNFRYVGGNSSWYVGFVPGTPQGDRLHS